MAHIMDMHNGEGIVTAVRNTFIEFRLVEADSVPCRGSQARSRSAPTPPAGAVEAKKATVAEEAEEAYVPEGGFRFRWADIEVSDTESVAAREEEEAVKPGSDGASTSARSTEDSGDERESSSFDAAAHGLIEPQNFSKESKSLVDEVASTTGRTSSYYSLSDEEVADTFDGASGSEPDTVDAMREDGMYSNPSSESRSKKQPLLEQCEQGASNTGATVIRPQGGAFQKESLKLVDEVAAVLRQTFGAEVKTGGWGLSHGEGCVALIVVIKPEDFAKLKNPVENVAREGLFNRCSRTRGVCLLGFKEEPFSASRRGFSATFASVPSNAKKECRRLYRNGFCRGACKFEHPTSVVHLDFTIARA